MLKWRGQGGGGSSAFSFFDHSCASLVYRESVAGRRPCGDLVVLLLGVCFIRRTVAFDPAGFIFDPLDDGRLLSSAGGVELGGSTVLARRKTLLRLPDAAARFTTAAESPSVSSVAGSVIFSIACRSYPAS